MNGNLAYKEDWREELIGGKIVMMAPASVNHNFASENIYYLFRQCLKGKSCTPFGDGTIVYLTEKDHFVPDMMVVCDRNKIKHDGVHGAPDLVVEVLSSSTMRNDRTYKKDVYERSGVREYWIVNPADKSVEVYRSNGTNFVLHDIYSLHPDWALAKMSEEEIGRAHV